MWNRGSMQVTMAVDPGKKACGVALLVGGTLVSAYLVKAPDPYEVAKRVQEWWWAERDRLGLGDKVDVLVTEGQQVYPGPRKADPNDLLPLSFVCGAVQARIPAKMRLMPKPREWKSNIAKEVWTRRILSRLSKEELKLVQSVKVAKSLQHNVIDSIGLGKWAIGLNVEVELDHDA